MFNLENYPLLKKLSLSKDTAQGAEYYRSIIDYFYYSAENVLEIGGGKNPTYKSDQKYVVNDISSYELEFIKKDKYKTALFDVAGDVPSHLHNSFDFIFSKFVLEHVKNGKMYYKNIYKLLKKGGISLTFHPTLFSLPFLINAIVPEKISEFIFDNFYVMKSKKKKENKIHIIKFPAYYSYCYSTDSHKKKIKDLGFSSVNILPLYGHHYYRKFKFISYFNAKITKIIKKKNIKHFSSYAYTILQK